MPKGYARLREKPGMPVILKKRKFTHEHEEVVGRR
jgi:hypothetical protein